MNTAVRLPIFVLCVLLVLWGWFMLAAESKTPPLAKAEGTVRTIGDTEERAQDLAPLVPSLPQAVRIQAPAMAVELEVQDELGRPIEGAMISRCPKGGARILSPGSSLGVTDAAGLYVVSRATSGEESGLLVVSAQGYVSQSMFMPADNGRYVMRLARGSLLELRVQSLGGAPLSGVFVVASMIALPDFIGVEELSMDWGLGSDPRSTLRLGHTDDSGVVVLTGLPSGRFHVRAWSETHLQVSIDGRRSAVVDVEGDTSRYTVACGELCVAALATNVPPSAILDYTIHMPRGHISGGAVEAVLAVERRAIERRFPDAQVAVSLAKDASTYGDASFRYETIGYGNLEHEVPFVGVGQFVSPTRLRASEVARPATGSVVITIPQARGSSAPLRAWLRPKENSLNGISCSEGEPREVPVGVYHLDLGRREWVRAFEVPERIEVAEGVVNEVVLEVKRGLLPVHVALEVPPVLREEYVLLTVSGQGMTPRTGRTRSGAWDTWLPRGWYELRAEVAGAEAVSTRLEVSGNDEVVVTLDLNDDV